MKHLQACQDYRAMAGLLTAPDAAHPQSLCPHSNSGAACKTVYILDAEGSRALKRLVGISDIARRYCLLADAVSSIWPANCLSALVVRHLEERQSLQAWFYPAIYPAWLMSQGCFVMREPGTEAIAKLILYKAKKTCVSRRHLNACPADRRLSTFRTYISDPPEQSI